MNTTRKIAGAVVSLVIAGSTIGGTTASLIDFPTVEQKAHQETQPPVEPKKETYNFNFGGNKISLDCPEEGSYADFTLDLKTKKPAIVCRYRVNRNRYSFYERTDKFDWKDLGYRHLTCQADKHRGTDFACSSINNLKHAQETAHWWLKDSPTRTIVVIG
ncbi:hypothetical protein MHLP_01145 [Candidatus Mycoplasma haematolamae str. Purdue]|uniref:Uncharacterized protein n=1 Tax=Mycoplasma haematolamae (strain Purdue) TaxID=1212765 RepID=I7CIW0_MYCHA|nr:hypothetical protein [Candidatus Mycoplasma haematolamae]AFO51809.1 hypothetical protein MHLP_01145 [Candidatus Mycoplasma haematolamae str. Purdue]